MDSNQFEMSKSFNYYDQFMEKVLEFDSLTMEDYMEFMPKVLPIILQETSKDPVVIFESVIQKLKNAWTASDQLPFHGPWHHGIVPAVLIAALKNNDYDFIDQDVKEAFTRGLKIPAGGCGFCGTCGGGCGVGIAISISQKATPFHDKQRSLGFEASLKAQERIGKLGGPRCCRLSAYVAIEQAIKFLKKFDYQLPEQKMIGRCNVYELNEQCHLERCPYYPKNL
ncbi:MAG: hypothetical protein EU539_10745 [Promethearchaeota archaeon]|nr:MAG: hypothetical protein EU539_10745 [Candidatus Lokiarchaeota archaeon]